MKIIGPCQVKTFHNVANDSGDIVHYAQSPKYTFNIESLSGIKTIELTKEEFMKIKNMKQNYKECDEKYIDEIIGVILQKLIDQERINIEAVNNSDGTVSFKFNTEEYAESLKQKFRQFIKQIQ